MKLLMAVKQRWARIGGDYVNFDLLPRGNYHHVLEHARGWFMGDAGNLERVPVEMHRMCFGALVIKD